MKTHTIGMSLITEEARQGDVLISAEAYYAVNYCLTSWPEEPLCTWMVPGTYQIIGGPDNADVHAN